jgi:hypothetical protein
MPPRKSPQAAASQSAFERRSTRSHFSILGRKVKGQSTDLLASRSAASEKRKLTLLQEYRQACRSVAAPRPALSPLRSPERQSRRLR